jgi:HSP20 family protein
MSPAHKKPAKRRTAKKRAATQKKTAKKAAAGRKRAASKAPAKEAAAVPVKTEPPESAFESRLLAPLTEMERMLSDFRRDWLRPSLWEWPHFPDMPSVLEGRFPSIDVVNRDKEVVVKAEVPGIEKDDLEVSISDRNLTIKGQSRQEEKKEDGELFRQEIRSRSFSRVITLPAEVDAKKAKASYKDGVVELTLPKVRKSTTHKVQVD